MRWKNKKDAELIHLQEKHPNAFWPMSTNPKHYSNCFPMQYKHSKPLYIYLFCFGPFLRYCSWNYIHKTSTYFTIKFCVNETSLYAIKLAILRQYGIFN